MKISPAQAAGLPAKSLGLFFAIWLLPAAFGAKPLDFKEPPARGLEASGPPGLTEDLSDPHLVLGIAPDASLSEAKAAYSRLRFYWHPDRNRSLEAGAVFHAITKAYEALVEEERGVIHADPDILHRAIQGALVSVAHGKGLRAADRELKKTLELLLQNPGIKRFINNAKSADSKNAPPVYGRRGTPLQMALYLPESAALLLESGADAGASGPDLLPPVEQAVSLRTEFFPFQSYFERRDNPSAADNLAVFNMLRRHGKIDLSRTSSAGETVLGMAFSVIVSLEAQSWQYRAVEERREARERQVCPPLGGRCEPQRRLVYCPSCESAKQAKKWKKLFFQLIEEGADLNAPNSKGQTVLALAVMSRNKISQDLIRLWGDSIDWEYKDSLDRTYLQLAIDSGDEQTALNIVKISGGADMSYRNRHGKSYLESALESNFRKLPHLLARDGGFELLKANEQARVISRAAERRDYPFLRIIQPLLSGSVRPRQLEGGRPKLLLSDKSGGQEISESESGPAQGRHGVMAGAAGPAEDSLGRFNIGAAETAALLMEERESGASDSGAMKPKKPPASNWLSRFFDSLFAPRPLAGGSSADKCRDSFRS